MNYWIKQAHLFNLSFAAYTLATCININISTFLHIHIQSCKNSYLGLVAGTDQNLASTNTDSYCYNSMTLSYRTTSRGEH